jgi:hypothetical protein
MKKRFAPRDAGVAWQNQEALSPPRSWWQRREQQEQQEQQQQQRITTARVDELPEP